MADYEVLEMFLYLIIPRGDTKPIAKALLDRFGTIGALIEADAHLIQEIDGVGPAISHAFKVHQALAQRQLKQQVIKKPIFSNWEKVLDYCHAHMTYNMREQLRLLFLNKRNQLIAAEVQQTGTVDHTPSYPREIIKRALDLGASALIMVHNHPSGDPTPSQSDIDITRQTNAAAQALGVILHDHIIIGKDCHVSLKALGIL